MATVDEFKRRNYYQRLGLPRSASISEVKEAYREIARVYHPDSHYYEDLIEYELTEDDIAIFQMVTAAYDTLIREERRKEYDRSLPPDTGDGMCEAPKPTIVKGTKEWDAPSQDGGPAKQAEFKTSVKKAEKPPRDRKTTGAQDMKAAREQFAQERARVAKKKEAEKQFKAMYPKLVTGVVTTIWVGIGCLLLYLL